MNVALFRWWSYENEARGFGGYLPDPDELDERINTCRRLRELGASNEIADHVLVHGDLSIDTLERMVYRHGVIEACRRLAYFLETDDDD